MTTSTAYRDLWLTTIRTEGDRLAAIPPEFLDAPVPGLPDWTVERVVRHVGKVYRWATGLLDAPTDADPNVVAKAAASLPRGPECLGAYRGALEELLSALAAADPDRPIASFTGPADVAFWLRRMAHETAVHRIDAADAVHAAGGPAPAPIDARAAADGVGEWLEVFALNHPGLDTVRASGSGDGTKIGFHAVDVDPEVDPAAWLLRWDDDSRPGFGVVSPEHAAGSGDAGSIDVSINGPAEALLLTLWRRRPIGTVEIVGDVTVAEALIDTVRA